MSALPPSLSDAKDRIAEMSEILARGLVRLRARQSRRVSAEVGESCVDFSVDQRGHDIPNQDLGDAE